MNKINKYSFHTKDDMLNKLRAYTHNPDDDNIRIKNQVYQTLLHCPELLYAIHDAELESELFDDDGNLNVDADGEPLGEWDRYFGENAHIRPYIFFPETETDSRNYVCYQTSFSDLARYNNSVKTLLLTFTIFIHEKDVIVDLTGLPRHDLIAAILRDRFAWIGTEVENPIPSLDKESTMDNNYLVRTLQYQIITPNNITKTENGKSFYSNKRW